MKIELDDPRLRARITFLGYDRAKIVIEFPRTPEFRDHALAALARFLQPEQIPPATARDSTTEQPA